MFSFSKPPKIVSQDAHKGVFEVEALYPGYGVTIGNSLRRVLVSSLEGAAVTRVKIAGVSHEFSTIDGVLEDVVILLLNLKKLRFLLHGEEKQIVTLQEKGEKEVTGADLKLPTQVELMNPGQKIATLTTKNATLSFELEIEKGIGYVPAEERRRGKEEIGSVALDAIFTPIRKVSYRVEQMRVGEHTDFDRLIIEIETDGSIRPQEALRQAVTILKDQYVILLEGLPKEEATTVSKESAKAAVLKPKRAKKQK